LSGQKVAGCCVHVATVIYYLSYARYNTNKIPAEYLNKIFVDISKKEPANIPRYVRNKRQTCMISSSESSSSSESESEGKTSSLDKSLTLSDSRTDVSSINNDYSVETLSNYDEENDCFEPQNSINIQEIKGHVPQWGGKINYHNRKVKVSDTCTIDYFLFALWLQFKLTPNFYSMIPDIKETAVIKNIIQSIDSKQWNKAKEIWINDMMQYKEEPIRNSISMFGSEIEHFVKYLAEYQTHKLVQQCNVDCINNENVIIQNDSDNLYFKKLNNIVHLYNGFLKNCNRCRHPISCKIIFKHQPNFIFVQSAFGKITFNELPKNIKISNKRYDLLCSSVHKRAHFYGIFKINENLYLMDDLDQSFNILSSDEDSSKRKIQYIDGLFTSLSLYYLK
jgi:hypothetical protein